MFARRLVIVAGARSLDEMSERGGRGRLGALLASNGPQRRLAAKLAARTTFKANADAERRLLAELPDDARPCRRLSRRRRRSAATEPNVADMMIAPSLALLDYRLDMRDQVRARPAFAIVERLLPGLGPRRCGAALSRSGARERASMRRAIAARRSRSSAEPVEQLEVDVRRGDPEREPVEVVVAGLVHAACRPAARAAPPAARHPDAQLAAPGAR